MHGTRHWAAEDLEEKKMKPDISMIASSPGFQGHHAHYLNDFSIDLHWNHLASFCCFPDQSGEIASSDDLQQH